MTIIGSQQAGACNISLRRYPVESRGNPLPLDGKEAPVLPPPASFRERQSYYHVGLPFTYLSYHFAREEARDNSREVKEGIVY